MSEADSPITSLEKIIEALLLVAPGPVTVNQLASTISVSNRDVDEAITELERRYETGGLRIQHHHGHIQLTTAPELAVIIEKFLGLEDTRRLSRAALETLAIIAYQQPITRPKIDSIRGVNSDGVLKSLLQKGMIQEFGREEGAGRPILYCTTPEFLQHFGLNTLDDLPPLDFDLESLQAEMEDPDLLKD